MQHKHYYFIQYSDTIGFAGSRHGSVNQQVCSDLISLFAGLGSHFLVGCAPGIDQCFRAAIATSSASSRSTIHCAFPSRLRAIEKEGLRGMCLVSNAVSAAAALHQRTVTIVSQCSFLVLFPDDPTTGSWGKGSRLAFNTAVQQHKPAFVVTAIPPIATHQFRVTAGSLFGIVSGYWILPFGAALREGEIHAEQ